MRLPWKWIVPVPLFLVIACNTVSPDECWPNTTGGFGGAETLPFAAAVGAGTGDFASPPSGPLDSSDAPNPCLTPGSPCEEKCLNEYESRAAGCGSMADVAARRVCQDDAHGAYKSCRAACVSAQKTCLDMYEDCTNRNYAPCNKKFENTLLCSICQDNCLKGNPYKFAECKQCGFE